MRSGGVPTKKCPYSRGQMVYDAESGQEMRVLHVTHNGDTNGPTLQCKWGVPSHWYSKSFTLEKVRASVAAPALHPETSLVTVASA